MIKEEFRRRYEQCIVSLPGEYKLQNNTQNVVVFSTDCVFQMERNAHGNRCDEFIFFDLRRNIAGIYLIERKKNKSNNVEQVRKQLQGGADFITTFLSIDPALDMCDFDFLPVWVSGGTRDSLNKKLKGVKISLTHRTKYKEKRIRLVINKQKLPKFNR